MKKTIYVLILLMFTLASCDKDNNGNDPDPTPGGGGGISKGYAPTSAIGETFVIGFYTVKVTGKTSCTVSVGNAATFTITGTPTCSYTKTGNNTAKFNFKINIKPAFALLGYTSGSFDLTLNMIFDRENGGTFTGYNSYVYVGGSLEGSGSTNTSGGFSMF